ncbi:MAG: sigma-70 family RNA polymerase sigma factor [Anaerolineales bacterium]|nr:sigma-70 family RNA polymerase sigma factor [Anaerolineales bacterium]
MSLSRSKSDIFVMLYWVKLLKPGGVIWNKSAGKVSHLSDQDYNEEDVLARASHGDREAFGRLYERYAERIFNYVYYRTGNQHDAEDLTARVFQRAMNHIRNYTDRGVPFSAWLYRIAHNLVANWHRDRSRKQEIPIDDLPILPTKGDHPERNLVRSQEQDSLLKMIRKLPPERQNLLILKFVEDMSNAEIGRIMGRSEGAVKSLYHRTLLALRDQLEDQNLNLEGE